MKTNILKKDGKAYIRLPDEFSNFDDVELFKLKDGYYLVTLPLAGVQPDRAPERIKVPVAGFQILGEAEKNVLKKLLAIKFNERTPAYVEKTLSAEEKNVLRELEDKSFINVFRGKKYPDGVYNINDRIYGALYGKETVAAQPPAPSAKREGIVQRPPDTLGQKGYAIGAPKDLAEIIEKHRDEIKSGKIKGLKGFDGRFYIAKMDYISKMSPLVMKQLDQERSIDEIAENLKIEPDAVRTVLHILAEAGDVMEKRRGVYAAI